MLYTSGRGGEPRVRDQVRAPQNRQDPLPLLIIDRKDADVTVLGRVRSAVARQQAHIADARLQRRIERGTPQMLEIVERQDGLEPRHLKLLPLPRSLEAVHRHSEYR